MSSAYRRLAGGEQCSLVLTDVHMQEMDGDELVRRVRADPRCNTLPMIVITGSGDTDLEAQLIDAGADDYIRKPIDPTRMLARVRGALRRSAA